MEPSPGGRGGADETYRTYVVEPGAWSPEPTPGGKGGELWRRQDGA